MMRNRSVNLAGDLLALTGYLLCCVSLAWLLHPAVGLLLLGAGLVGLGVRAALR